MNTFSLVRWAGGKGKQLNDLLPLIPQTRVFVEPFGGGCSVLLNRERSEVEVYNDLDGALVNLFEILRDDHTADELRRILDLTPYSREVFEDCLSFEGIADPVRRAAAFYTVLNQSISGKRLASKGDWSRGRADNLAERWFQRQEKLGAIHERIRHVQIECRDALDILQEWDTAETTFYCDPPYILDTRRGKRYYAVEPGDSYHDELVSVLLGVRGNVVLSGYDHPIYHRLITEGGWWTDVYGANATMAVVQAGESKSKDRSDRRVEIVYRNPQACERGVKVPLFTREQMGDSLTVGHVRSTGDTRPVCEADVSGDDARL
jgi:DNA adenine methylase